MKKDRKNFEPESRNDTHSEDDDSEDPDHCDEHLLIVLAAVLQLPIHHFFIIFFPFSRFEN